MPIGVFVNCFSVALGGVIGSGLGKAIPKEFHERLPILFGYCAIALGVVSITKASGMTLVVLAVLAGFCVGHLLRLESKARRLFGALIQRCGLCRDGLDMELYITVVAMFCCSGLGWYGALTESIAGSAELLFSKSVLDFFTALLFGAILGRTILLIPILQLGVMLLVFAAGKGVGAFVTDTMFRNLSACGGILTLATGFRVARIQSVAVIDMLPALLLILPLSALPL